MYKKSTFWLFSLPTLLAFLLFVIIPSISGFFYAFTNWNGIKYTKFVGFQNFITAFHNERFINAFMFTTKLTIATIIGVNIVGFILALLVTRKIKGLSLFRAGFFLPNLIGGLVLGFLWQAIFLVLFPQLHLPNLLSNAVSAFWAYIILIVWQMSGYVMVIYVAALQNVPRELIEAADIDGANFLQKLRHIIWPLVAPAFTVSLFLTLSNAFKMFDQNLALTEGGPYHSTTMLSLDIYQTAFSAQRLYGLAQAKSIIFLLVVVTISLIQVSITKKREVEM